MIRAIYLVFLFQYVRYVLIKSDSLDAGREGMSLASSTADVDPPLSARAKVALKKLSVNPNVVKGVEGFVSREF